MWPFRRKDKRQASIDDTIVVRVLLDDEEICSFTSRGVRKNEYYGNHLYGGSVQVFEETDE